MKIIAIIPARYESSRFPGKPLALIKGVPMVCLVYDNVVKTGLFDEVIVATDNLEIKNKVQEFKGKVILTSKNHKSGTDRVAEVAENIDADIIVNVQGDEPLISKNVLSPLVDAFNEKEVEIASLMTELKSNSLPDSNIVKVVVNKKMDALYFSRAVIPFNRDYSKNVVYFRHIGVYAFRKKTLLDLVCLPLSNLENIEKLEQLRFLENGFNIRMIKTDYKGIGVDSPNDLKKINLIFGKE